MDAQGNLDGTTAIRGAYNYRPVSQLTPSGAEIPLYSFAGGSGRGGTCPYVGLGMDAQGNLSGAMQYGGAHGEMTIFSIPRSALVFSFAFLSLL